MEKVTLETKKRIEEASLNGWPPLEQTLYDGWVCRFARGYTRRANSITPLYTGTIDVTAKIRWCEQLYQRKGLRPIFRLTSLVEPNDLDDIVDQAGYQYQAPTSVQLLDLGSVPALPGVSLGYSEQLSQGWIENYMRMNQVSAIHYASLRGILNNIAAQCCFMTLLNDDRIVACGLGVREAEYIGLFDIVTDPVYRSQGLGTKLIMSILNWAKEKGAKKAYLQVMLNNSPALKLYHNLGFQEIYRYWYRTKEA